MKKLPTRRGDLRYWLVLAALLVMTPQPWAMGAGAAFVGLGAMLHLWAKGSLRQDTTLTHWGPYAWVRHPFYLANALVDAGVLFFACNAWLAAAAVPLWIWVYSRTIRREETRLVELFGERYAHYRTRVPAIVPAAWPLPAPSYFSWRNRNLVDGREWARVLRIAAYPFLFLYVWELKQGRWLSPWPLAATLVLHAIAFGLAWSRRRKSRVTGKKGACPPGYGATGEAAPGGHGNPAAALSGDDGAGTGTVMG